MREDETEVEALTAEVTRLRNVLMDWGGKLLAENLLSHVSYKKGVYNK